MNKCDYALKYAGLGIRVFPITAGTKKPAVDNWPDLATTDPRTIKRWWSIDENYNIGVATGGGVIAVDADTKNGKPGLASLEALDLEILPQSFRVSTPSGGVHVLLRTNAPVANRADTIDGYRGIDIRGDNGYILGAGSYTVDGPSTVEGEYTLLSNGGIEDMPPEFAEVLSRRTKHKDHTANPVAELDDEIAITKAVAWLQSGAPEAIEGAGGDEATFRTAAWLRDIGLSEGAALETMLEHWNDNQSPPWQPDELAVKVANAYAYATGTWGGRSVQADFETIDLDVGERPDLPSDAIQPDVQKAVDAKKRRARFTVFDADASHRAALTDAALPLIDGVINKGTFAVLYGKPKTSKTFNAIDMGMCIALGKPWSGRYDTAKGAVLYVALEGGTKIHARVAAAKVHHNAPEHTPFYLLPATVNLVGSNDDAKEIARLANSAAARSETPIVLIVIDTVHRSMSGGDENSTTDMGAFVGNIDLIRELTGAAVLAIHHTGKDEAKGMRGSSALLGAIDTEIYIDGEGKMQTTNQRDLTENENLATATLIDVVVGHRADGAPVSSAAVEYGDGGDFVDAMPLSDDEQRMYDVLEALVRRARLEGRAPVVTWQEWVIGCRSQFTGDGEGGGSERVLVKRAQAIVSAGWAAKKKRGQYVLSRQVD